MKKIVSIFSLSLALFTTNKGNTQVDPHFTQHYNYPMWLNPALTGAMDGDYRVSSNYRNQWAGLTNPFNTYGVSADMTTDKNLNFGINLMAQTAGDVGYRHTNATFSVAYTGVKFGFNGRHRLSFGLQGGWIDRRITNFTAATLGDSYNAGNVNNPLPTSEVLNNNSGSYFDANAGVLYYDALPEAKYKWFGGFSVAHINKPSDPLIKKTTSIYTVPMRFIVHGGVRIALENQWTVIPNAMYLKQGDAQSTMLGVYAEKTLNETTDLLFGLNYRFDDAVSPYIGFYYNSFTFGLSYDVNASQLSRYLNNANTFELSLSYILKKKRSFDPGYFKCPRL